MLSWILGRNPIVLLWGAVAALVVGAAAGGWGAWNVQGLRLKAAEAKYDTFVAGVKTAGELAEQAAKQKEVQYANTVKEINNGWAKNINRARSEAVRNYIATRGVPDGSASGSQVPSTAVRAESTDGAGKECLPDTRLIEDAAEDALKIRAWQDWAVRNELPVSDQ